LKPRAEDLRLWAVVAATVRPLVPRAAPAGVGPLFADGPVMRLAAPTEPREQSLRSTTSRLPQAVEPGRYRRLARGREAIGGKIDLHGLGQDAAHAALITFVERAAARGVRGVLVITGKGALGDGVLRRRTPEWLAQPPLRAHVAGLSEAHRHHGGAGAIYVALRASRLGNARK
jgi:DNA-nicking Smr family endonuclease